MVKSPPKRVWRRDIIGGLTTLIAIMLLCEVVLRIVYFQQLSEYPLAGTVAINQAVLVLSPRFAQSAADSIPEGTFEALYSPEGVELLAEFKSRYEAGFSQLVDESRDVQAMLVIVYIPSGDYQENDGIVAKNRQFFAGLAQEYDIGFVDMTGVFEGVPPEDVTLLPENPHLSRYGNRLVAGRIGAYINEGFGAYRSGWVGDRPPLLGDLNPGENRIWEIDPKMPYKVRVNRQGLRGDEDAMFPKDKQRILLLGDSFTFSPYLDNHDSITGLLNKKYPGKEFFNAGVVGYTISDELSLFQDRAKHIEADIVILQVTDNDLHDLFYFKRNWFGRQRLRHEPSGAEAAFLAAL